MSEIQFETPQIKNRDRSSTKNLFFVHLVLKTKLVKTPKQATYVLIVFVIFAAIFAFIKIQDDGRAPVLDTDESVYDGEIHFTDPS